MFDINLFGSHFGLSRLNAVYKIIDWFKKFDNKAKFDVINNGKSLIIKWVYK